MWIDRSTARRALPLAATLVALLAAPSSAPAFRINANPGGASINFWGSPGEVNTITVRQGPNLELIIRDRTATTSFAQVTGPRCTVSPDRHEVVCAYLNGTGVLYLTLGDGADRANLSGIRSRHENRRAVLFGEGGDDVLIGGAWADTLDGGPGADLLDGGPGTDLADYRDRSLGVRVTLDGRAYDGGAGEHDNVRATIETVFTGSGDDFISGSNGADRLSAGRGDDRVEGRGGSDLIDGGDGDDVLIGGLGLDILNGMNGDDVLDALDDHAEGGKAKGAVHCGAGRDRARLDQSDVTEQCEREDRLARSSASRRR